MLAFVIQNQPHRTGADLGRELVCRLACHGSTFSGVGASDQPGAVHRKLRRGFGVGVSSAIRWIARAKIGELAPRPQGRRRVSSLDAHEVFIVGLFDERKTITLNLVERLLTAQSVRISRSALSARLGPQGWTLKKIRARTGTGLKRRRAWFDS